MAKELDEHTMLVIRTTAKETVEEHQRNCSAYKEFFGDGTDANPGIKQRVWMLEQCKKQLSAAGGLIRQCLVPVVSTLITMAVTLGIGWNVMETRAKASGEKPKTEQKEKATTDFTD